MASNAPSRATRPMANCPETRSNPQQSATTPVILAKAGTHGPDCWAGRAPYINALHFRRHPRPGLALKTGANGTSRTESLFPLRGKVRACPGPRSGDGGGCTIDFHPHKWPNQPSAITSPEYASDTSPESASSPLQRQGPRTPRNGCNPSASPASSAHPPSRTSPPTLPAAPACRCQW